MGKMVVDQTLAGKSREAKTQSFYINIISDERRSHLDEDVDLIDIQRIPKIMMQRITAGYKKPLSSGT